MPQGKFISKEELKQILQSKPAASTERQVLEGLLQRGFQVEGLVQPEGPTELGQGNEAEARTGFGGFLKNIGAAINPFNRLSGAGRQKGTEAKAELAKDTARLFAPLGETIGEAFAAPFVVEQQAGAQRGKTAMIEAIGRKIQETDDPVKKRRLMDLLKRQQAQNVDFASAAAPSLDKTGLQIAGEGIQTGLSVLAGGTPSAVAAGSFTPQASTKAVFGITSSAAQAGKFFIGERMARIGVNAVRGGIGGLGGALISGDEDPIDFAGDVLLGAGIGAIMSVVFEKLDANTQRRLLQAEKAQGKLGEVYAEELRINKRKLMGDIRQGSPDIADDIARDAKGYRGSYADMMNQAKEVHDEVWTPMNQSLKQASKVVGEQGDEIIPTIDIRQSLNFQTGQFAEATPDNLFQRVDKVMTDKLKPDVAKHAVNDIAGKFRLRYGVEGAAMADDMLVLLDKADDLTIGAIDDHAATVLQKTGVPLIKRDELLAFMLKQFPEDPTSTITVAQRAGLQTQIESYPKYMTLWEANNLKINLYKDIPQSHWMAQASGASARDSFSGETKVSIASWLRNQISKKADSLEPGLGNTIKELNKRYGVATEVLNGSVKRIAEERTSSTFGATASGFKQLAAKVFKELGKKVGVDSTAVRTNLAQLLRRLATRDSFARVIIENPIMMNLFLDFFSRESAELRK